jgi:outer membrane biosynthesis protein TonB
MRACRSIRMKPVAFAKEADRRGMRPGPPPSSASSLPAAFFSLIAHASVVLAGVIMIPVATSEIESTPMVYIPIELVSIADSTNVAPVFEAVEIDEEDPVEAESEAAPAPAAAAATPDPEDTVALDPPKPEAPKQQPKPAAKPAPAAPAKSLSSELDDILASVSKDTPAPKRSNPNADPASAGSGPPRPGVGDMKRNTATVTDFIRAQLVNNKCWTDHSDMADARRLKATFRVKFDRNNKMTMSELVSPSREPIGDGPLQTFIAHARRALDMCNKKGWNVPPEYFNLPQPQTIDIEFLPKIATQ